MTNKRASILILLGSILATAPSLFGQASEALTCTTTQTAVPPVIRAEGLSERLGDITVTCNGIPTYMSVTVRSYVPLTNRRTANGDVDAFLIFNDPHSATNPTTPLLICGAPGTNDDGHGNCPMSDSAGWYDGLAGHPNVFQGTLTGANVVTWSNLPGKRGPVSFRISGLRVDLGSIDRSAGNGVTVYVSIVPMPVSAPVFVAAYWLPAVSTTVTPLSTLRSCQGANPTIAADPTRGLDTGGQSGAQFSVTLQESFATAFAVKNIAQQLANSSATGQFGVQYPTDLNQNIIGYPYNTETGLYNYGLDPNPPLLSAVTTTPRFPAIRLLDTAGVVSQGTRVYAKFSNVPSGMQLYVPTVVSLVSKEPSTLNQKTGIAVLVATDANGAGAYSPVTGNASGLAAATLSGTTAMVVYEVLYTDPSKVEAITIPVAAAYQASTGTPIAGAQSVTVQAGLAPLSTITATMDTTVPVPRFSANAATSAAFLTQPCGQPDLTISMSHSGAFAPNGSGNFSLAATNSGDTPTSGTVTVGVIPGTGLTATGLFGSGWNCNLAGLTCTRNDSVAAGASYPPISFAVAVSPNAAAAITSSAIVSGGGESLTANDTATDVVYPAPLQTITVGTSPGGLAFTVDNTVYTARQTFRWASGSTHTISVDATQPVGGTTLVFNNWSDQLAQGHTITVGTVAADYTATYGSSTASILCRAVTQVLSARSDGLSELMGGLRLDCTGGTPTASGSPLTKLTFALDFNTTVTSRITADGYTEALLIIDEPHLRTQWFPLLACGDSGTYDDGSGVCSITSLNGSGIGNYQGQVGHPNVYQARVGANPNQLVWRDIPVDAPGTQTTRTFLFTNLRANVKQLGVSTTADPTLVTATVSVTPNGLAVSGPYRTYAVSEVGIDVVPATGAPASLSQCTSANPSIAADPARALDVGGQNGAQFSLGLTETFQSALRVKNAALLPLNGGGPGLYPSDINQNFPELVFNFNTETGFYNGALTDANPGLTGMPTLPVHMFPLIRGLRNAGKADAGTRIYLKFAGIPASVRLFVPVTVAITNNQTGQISGTLRLTATDTSGAGAFTGISGNASGLAPVTATSGVGLAVYEVVATDPDDYDGFTVPVAAAYAAGSAPSGTITVEYGFAPFSLVSTAGVVGTPVPRFSEATTSRDAFRFTACTAVDLKPNITASALAKGDHGDTLAVTVSNLGTSASSGTVSVQTTLPTGLTATAISGPGWSCSLSTLLCSTSSSIPAGSTTSPVTVTVDVASDRAATVVVSATVSGGGDGNGSNNTTQLVSQLAATHLSVSGVESLWSTTTLPYTRALTVTVSSGTGIVNSGTVTVNVGTVATFTGTVSNGRTIIPITLPIGITAGTYHLDLSYSGAAGIPGAVAASSLTIQCQTSITVGPRTISYSANPRTIPVSVSINSWSPVPPGILTLTLMDGNATHLAYAIFTTLSDILNFPIPALSPGRYSVVATYDVASYADTGQVLGSAGSETLTVSAQRPAGIAAFSNGSWKLDVNGNSNWDGVSTDRAVYWSLGRTGEIPVSGDWNGDGRQKVGLYVGGTWLLDYNGNGVWDGPDVDKLLYFGGPDYIPVVGDWNGSGTAKVGVYHNGTWLLDYNGNFQWDGINTDKLLFFGDVGYSPVVGDWNGSGNTKLGVHRNGTWILDFNGNFQWDGINTDKLIFFGGPGYTPVVGDWNGTTTTKVGAYKDGLWVVDYNGNFAWDGLTLDRLAFFGGPEYTPLVGDWNAAGIDKVGAFSATLGLWVLDMNGNYTWDPPADRVTAFGGPGQTPVVGKW